MATDEFSGIDYPDPGVVLDNSRRCALLDAVASQCANFLLEGGYFSDLEANALLSGYQCRLISSKSDAVGGSDFMEFVAETQAQKHFLTAAVEVARMQKILRWSLSDRVRIWTFGPLAGAGEALYERGASIRTACRVLGCPAIMAGEISVVHVVSVNPVAALVASAWLKRELAFKQTDGEAPFLFPLMVDLGVWKTMLHAHF